MKISSTNAVSKEVFSELMRHPEQLFEMLRIDAGELAGNVISSLLKTELTSFLGRDKHTPSTDGNYRNGSYPRKYAVKGLGELNLNIPRDRKGEFQSNLINKYERYDKSIAKDVSLLFLAGLSTRNISLLSKSLLGRKISSGEVSEVNKELLSGIDKWKERDLSNFGIKYLYIDGVNFKTRVNRKVEIVPVLVVIGVTTDDRKVFLGIQQGDKESAETWREVFKDLKSRGLNKDLIELGIMDGLSGLMTVFKEEFPLSSIQRCQVHVARNVLTKVPRSQQKQVSNHLREIFYADSKIEALDNYNSFIEQYKNTIPSAVKCLNSVKNQILTFFDFPKDSWISLRTTNPIERVNKEFKRRTKPMEIMAGEASTYRLLCFIALKMEVNWKSHPINSGKLNNFTFTEFTQLN
jgi:putative transposase